MLKCMAIAMSLAILAVIGCASKQVSERDSEVVSEFLAEEVKKDRAFRAAQAGEKKSAQDTELEAKSEEYKRIGAAKLKASRARASAQAKNGIGYGTPVHTTRFSDGTVITTYKRGNVYTVVTTKNGKIEQVSKHY